VSAERPELSKIFSSHVGKVSDKWTIYVAEYARHFQEYRDRPVRLLEIGIQNGGSLEIWGKYFTRAKKLVGCDIDPRCKALRFENKKIAVLVGDANTDKVEKQILAKSPGLDLVIDDGSHKSSDIIRSFIRYFKHLSDGGLYVTEDLHCSYWHDFEGGIFRPLSSIAFFKSLADVINHQHWGVTTARTKLLTAFNREYEISLDEETLCHIHSIEFVNSMCVVRKEAPAKNHLGNRIVVGTDAVVDSAPLGLHGTACPEVDQSANIWSVEGGQVEQELARLGEDNERLIRLVAERDESCAALTRKIAELESGIGDLTHALSERENRFVDLTQKIAGLQAQLVVLDGASLEHESQVLNLNQAVASRDGEISALNQTITERDNQIASLSETATYHDGQRIVLEAKLIEYEERLLKLADALAAEQKAHRQLEHDSVRRESALIEKSNDALQALEKFVRDQSTLDQSREMQRDAQLVQAEQHKALLVREFTDRENQLRQAQAEREQALVLQLDSERGVNRQQEHALRRLERTLQDEITGLRIRIEEQRHANQSAAQQFSYEIDAIKVERNLALEARNVMAGRVVAEQQENSQLRQAVAALQRHLAQVHGSLLWRMFAPLRRLGPSGALPAELLSDVASSGYEALHSRRISKPIEADEPQRVDGRQFDVQMSNSQRSVNKLVVDESVGQVAPIDQNLSLPLVEPPTFESLMQLDDHQFVNGVYAALLRRLPDSEGLNFYLGAIQSGTNKLQILREIFLSQEAKDVGVEVAGLREALAQSEFNQ
jgi:Domain of unknown function (DUF4214)